ncbi:hypothetical protein SERLA73DRAFT_76843 [Serpula lacrymans var. lacrymans S7.3]|uniref:OB domain-containing protein n=1 Tax=Serpula lacrymans var. lacrymans (strain S7.3) TaxID=936435 RepID=F8Q893_SERL3|nr:hypothetical protein SERLA73DRAFT_76843 [Serpula lacrymans var. lacrymans S7.3]
MGHYRIFLGAPPSSAIDEDAQSYTWNTIQQTPSHTTSVVYPAATLEAASRRISLLYKNIIFDDDDEEEQQRDLLEEDELAYHGRKDETTVITWPPTQNNRLDRSAPSFLYPSQSHIQQSMHGTYETQETDSCDYSDASSIARFPSFQFSLHTVISLSSLHAYSKAGKGSQKVCVLLAVLEVEGPDTIRIKKGSDAGKEVSILKILFGDEDGNVCKLTAWREIAETWGGNGTAPALKRGDVAYIKGKFIFR